ncbi:maleylpyruvate isomerase family mycothiol-dependent enzyme [Glutamicibacter sp. NPDC087344]|uniref:maleylpyruvate isomerase family mycothiol-dependent enzyme n=1 Tax=Glutamicibacter sp. NPDC087344 TaxID=3363994 RepID=UPI0037F312FE
MTQKPATQIWSLVHAERQALIGDLQGLHAADWANPTACPGWNVHDVAAHLVDNALTTPLGFLRRLVAARLDFDRLNQRGVDALRAMDPEQLLRRLRQVAGRRTGPPAAPASRLVEEIVHGEDIRRAAGLRRDYPHRALELALGYQAHTAQEFGGARQLAQRVQLVSADGGFRLGLGPELRGPRLELLLQLTGRRARPGSLSGAGLALLAEHPRHPGE